MITQEKIEAVKNRIVDFMHPEKIIMFGSYADGKANSNSDLDLLVIADSDLPPYKRVRPIKNKLRGIGFPVDILVYTPDEIEKWKNNPLAFVTKVIKNGVVLYGR